MTHEGTEHDDAADLRVVLVGRTSLDQSLRRDPCIEVIRARDGLCAVGEVAEPIDAASPRRTAVLVAPEAVTKQDWPDFVAAVRSIQPEARVVRIADNGRTETDAEPACDGVIDAEADPAQLRAMLNEPRLGPSAPAAPSEPPANDAETTPEQTPSNEEKKTKCAPARDSDSTAELSALDALLAGRDALEPCLETIRTRLDADDVRFIPADESSDSSPSNELNEAPVQRRGRTFGVLRSRWASAQSLRAEADWLARWLALAEQHAQLREAAFKDWLTGAWNRRYFEYFLASAIEQARRRRHDVTLMVYDIDNFKDYNDCFGHAAGDEILRETVRLLMSVIRPTDRVCRVGGDEFAVIFDDPHGPRDPRSHHPTSIHEIASRFQRQICEHRFPKLGVEAPSTLTISGGMATFPWDGHCPDSLLAKADELALMSKRQGKNLITFGPGAERVCRIRFSGQADPGRADDAPARPPEA